MNFEEIKEVLNSISYKPDHYFEAIVFGEDDENGERRVDGAHWVDPHPGGGNQARKQL